MQGIFKRYKSESGYGFIAGEDNNDYFVHVYDIENPYPGRDPKPGDQVIFTPVETEKGLRAIEAVII